MRREKDHNKAIELRLKGQSYSQIKNKLGLSKSTLSGWLANYPLSSERIKELRDRNPRRIENFRQTMRRKREMKNQAAYSKVGSDIRKLSNREILIGGFFLYWGEGTKTSPSSVVISNTDPCVHRYFIRWIRLLKVPTEKIHVRLHLYRDMDVGKEIRFWSKELNLPIKLFRRPSIKQSNLSDVTYKNGFGHGTCHVGIYSRDLYDYVMMGLKFIREKYAKVL